MHQNYGFDKFINRPELRNTIKYVVKSGDTLYKIAEKYNTTVAEIVALNNLSTTMIYPNQILFIPSGSTTNSTTMTLKEFLISKGININGISEDSLSMYMKMSRDFSNDKLYEVLPNDTLDTILEKTKLTPYQLLNLNKAKWINPGEKIIIR